MNIAAPMGQPPAPGISDIQSYALILRNIFFDALSADPFFQHFNKRKNKMLVVNPAHLPYLGVYLIDETMVPDGEADQTNIKFTHTARIGFSVLVAQNDQEIAEEQIDRAFWRIMNRLWNDPVIMNVMDATSPSNPDNIRIEGLQRGVRRHVFGTAQFNNETPIAEVQYDVSCTFRSMWGPRAPQNLEAIDVETGVKHDDTQEEMDQRLQVQRKYNFPP